MSFPRYPKYKDSGVEWLGDVPEHWEVSRLKRICDVFPSNVDKKSVEGEAAVLLCNYTDVYYNDRIVADMNFMSATAADDQITRFSLQAGDTIITKDSETADDIAVAAYVPNDRPGVVCGYHLSMVRPRAGIDGAFVKRLFASSYAKSCFAVRANGLTRVGLSQYELDNVDMPVPPRAEQTAIAAFLDRETAKIDALIAEQQRLIELLQEKRQAVISHAVTKGLNPDVPMKDSGIEWLGEVPEHWEESRIDRVSDFVNGKAHEPFVDDDGNFICVNSRFISTNGEAVKMCNENLTPAQHDDVLMVMSDLPNGRALARTFHVRDGGQYAINQRVCAIRANAAFPRFLFYLLNRNPWFLQRDDGLNQTHLPSAAFRKMPLFLPPLTEQQRIAERLDRVEKNAIALATDSENAITLLQERRSALISAAVTGQIDVRGLAGSEAA